MPMGDADGRCRWAMPMGDALQTPSSRFNAYKTTTKPEPKTGAGKPPTTEEVERAGICWRCTPSRRRATLLLFDCMPLLAPPRDTGSEISVGAWVQLCAYRGTVYVGRYSTRAWP